MKRRITIAGFCREIIFCPRFRLFLGINIVALYLISGAIALAERSNLPVHFLFLPPATPPAPLAGILTHTFQLFCCVPPVVCLFTIAVLYSCKKRGGKTFFLVGSAFITGVFALNEVYRGHIILLYFAIPKNRTIEMFAIGFILYGLIFWKSIRETSYPILLLAIGLLAVAIGIDAVKIPNIEIASLVEGIPKLASGLNLALYYWEVCRVEIVRGIGIDTPDP
jgi:hypothetical protein